MKIESAVHTRQWRAQPVGGKNPAANPGPGLAVQGRVNATNSLTQQYARRVPCDQSRLQRLSAACVLSLLCLPCAFGATFRWSSALNKIYVEGGGTATLSAIKAALPTAPLDLVDAANKIWLLRADLLVADGSTLSLRGASVGGDVNELRLQSVNSSIPCN